MSNDSVKALLLSLPVGIVLAVGYELYPTVHIMMDSTATGPGTGSLGTVLSGQRFLEALFLTELCLLIPVFALRKRKRKQQ